MDSSASAMGITRSLFLGIDVGTGSARAGIFNHSGRLLATASSPIQIWKDGDYVEQSSTDIWLAVCAAVKAACEEAAVSGAEVCSIGFAATCSLVALGADDSPVTVSLTGDARRNVMVWMDHRAVDQAKRINATKSPVLEFVGGSLSPEMEAPKLLWVKENLPESWAVSFRWMDLTDWLTYRATGDDTRSLCTTVCKWTYLGHAHLQHQNAAGESVALKACGWDDVFWQEIGLSDLVEGHYAKIGRHVAFPGHPLGSGLTASAAKELGLMEGTPVATSLIDAHAGGVGVMESVSDGSDISERMVLVCGTSTCHMAVSPDKVFVPGVWGPYWSAMVPGFWLTEAGQSATGALIDHIIATHPAAPTAYQLAASQRTSVYDVLGDVLNELAAETSVPFYGALSKDVHVLPDFHGNRSPLADPEARGVVSGLSLDNDLRNLAVLYLATVQGIAYGTRHIVEHCNASGLKIQRLLACGGLSKNKVYMQQHADIVGCEVILPRERESVLLGAAILGAVAANKFPNVRDAMRALNAPGAVIEPSKLSGVRKYHEAKYKIFRNLYKEQLSHRLEMAAALGDS